jgi:hypothetical protein
MQARKLKSKKIKISICPSDVTANPNKPRKGGSVTTTAGPSVVTSVTTSFSEVSTQLSSTAENLAASSDYQVSY